jgi:hypothetical protein
VARKGAPVVSEVRSARRRRRDEPKTEELKTEKKVKQAKVAIAEVKVCGDDSSDSTESEGEMSDDYEGDEEGTHSSDKKGILKHHDAVHNDGRIGEGEQRRIFKSLADKYKSLLKHCPPKRTSQEVKEFIKQKLCGRLGNICIAKEFCVQSNRNNGIINEEITQSIVKNCQYALPTNVRPYGGICYVT